MSDSEINRPDEGIQAFIKQHGMIERSDYYNYHMSLGFYYLYSVDAFHFAEMIEDGEVFDEYEVSAVVKNLYLAHETLKYFQKRLNLKINRFDTAETVAMSDSYLEKGRIMGDKENAVKTARQWLLRFLKKTEPKIKKCPKEMGDKSISRDFFLYEVAIYILYLAGEEVDYGFLKGSIQQKEE